MTLSHRRKKELTKLRRNAEQLWSNQQHVIDQASQLARDATRQASLLASEAKREASYLATGHIAPRMRGHYEQHVLPHATTAGRMARTASDMVGRVVAPAVGMAIGKAVAVADAARDSRALGRIKGGKMGRTAAHKGGAGKFVLIGLAVAVAAGLAYAAWQTFRIDDELWVSDDEEEDALDEPLE